MTVERVVQEPTCFSGCHVSTPPTLKASPPGAEAPIRQRAQISFSHAQQFAELVDRDDGAVVPVLRDSRRHEDLLG